MARDRRPAHSLPTPPRCRRPPCGHAPAESRYEQAEGLFRGRLNMRSPLAANLPVRAQCYRGGRSEPRRGAPGRRSNVAAQAGKGIASNASTILERLKNARHHHAHALRATTCRSPNRRGAFAVRGSRHGGSARYASRTATSCSILPIWRRYDPHSRRRFQMSSFTSRERRRSRKRTCLPRSCH